MAAAAVAFLLIFSLISIILSGVLVAVIIHAKFYRKRQNVFVLVTSIYDLLRGVTLFTSAVIYFSPPPPEGTKVVCDVMIFLQSWTSIGCLLGVFTVLYDRLAYVTGPVTYKDRLTLKITVSLILYAILHPLFSAAVQLSSWGRTRVYTLQNSSHVFCELDWGNTHGYGYFLILWGYLIPLIIASYTFTRLSIMIRKRIRILQIYSSPEITLWPVGMRKAVQAGCLTELDASYMKIWWALTAIFSACVISWFIYIGHSIFLIVTTQGDAGRVRASATMLIFTLPTSVVNFLALSLYNTRYRKAVRSLFMCGRQHESDLQDISRFYMRSSTRQLPRSSLYHRDSDSIWSVRADSPNEGSQSNRPQGEPLPIPKTAWSQKTRLDEVRPATASSVVTTSNIDWTVNSSFSEC